jgi:acetaldehyde dehydrogenase/alcohol dehydrogenase
MVKAAYSCGKPALGVGAGNVPCYINASCDQDETVNDVVLSKAFDNGMICASESAVFIDESIYEAMKTKFAHFRVYFASPKEKHLLEKFMFGVESGKTWRREWQTQCRRRRHVPSELDRRKERLQCSGRHLDHGVELSKVGPEEPLVARKTLTRLGFLQSQRFEGRLRPR